VGQVSGVGYTGNGDLNEIGWLPRVVTGAMYEYSTGALTFGLGVGQTIPAAVVAPAVDAAGDEFFSVAVKYAAGNYSVALGYEDVGDASDLAGNQPDSQVSLLGSATFGSATVKLKLVDRKSAADLAAALSVDYVAGAATITAFATDNSDFAGGDALGLGVSYDLGGGAKMAGGVSKVKGGDAIADLGLTFSF
jgi:outer membrane protein OmpU